MKMEKLRRIALQLKTNMNFFEEIITNKCIYIPFLLWFFIQLFKFLTDLIVNKRINIKRIMGAGGMPSSHSAVVSSLAILIGKDYGFNSGVFALSLIMAFVVMYDAAGVRRETGRQGKAINDILASFIMEGRPISDEEMKEIVGHTPFEVFIGSIVGIVVAVFWIIVLGAV